MKYVIINGSPRTKNTWAVVKQVEKSLNGEFEEIHLNDMDIPLCKGCFICFRNGEEKCPHFEKLNSIVEKIKNADGIIIASPVYAMNVTALLKNFFDHTAYFYHRPIFFTKKALVIVTTAGAGHKDVSKYIDETLRHWGVNKVYKIALRCGGKDSLETDKIDKIAQKFRVDVESGKTHSPKFGDVLFFNVWKSLALTDDSLKADKEFWFNTDLVNQDFSPDVKIGPIKKLFSKIIFSVFKRVM